MLLVLVGGVMTVQADVTKVRIYFKPSSNWLEANAVFKANITNTDQTSWEDVWLTEYRNGIYYGDIPTTNGGDVSYAKFKFQRYSAVNGDWWAETDFINLESSERFYYMTGSNWETTYATSTYLPCNYYFTSNLDNWGSATLMDEVTSGTFTHTFNAATYTGKEFVWAPGDAFTSAGAMSDWNRAIRPKNTDDQYPGYKNNHWVLFSNLSYADGKSQIFDGTNAADANLWHVPTAGEGDTPYVPEGTITISFTKANNTATITCKKSASINATAGYATYSNSEPYIVSGAEVFVVTAKGNSSVHLDKLEEGTVLAANAGVILKGSGSVDILSANANPTTYSGTNYLVGSGNSSLNVTAGEGIYVFSWDGDNASSVGFYLASENGTLGAHKAYLDISTTSAPYLSFDFGDDTTSINEIGTMKNDGVIYSLSGVRLNKLQKGVNIVNGKKVVVK